MKLLKKAIEYSSQNYTYITFTSSFFNSKLDYQKSSMNTHTVIGQEFDKVCMILDENFYYDKSLLKAVNKSDLFDQFFIKVNGLSELLITMRLNNILTLLMFN